MNKTYSITIAPDNEGFIGRECPNDKCEGYFKIESGTGLPNTTQCYCPYCGHIDDNNQFWTKEQIEYAKSIVFNDVSKQVSNMFKSLERKPNPSSLFSIGITYKEGRLPPIHYYREKKLEQEVICNNCTLRYSIFGVFGFCPDCGIHNSLQILTSNLQIIEKMLNFYESIEEQIVKEKILENALKDSISSFDGFGREICKVNSGRAKNPNKVLNLSFQNITNADSCLFDNFNFKLSSFIEQEEWKFTRTCFEKRHLLSHKMGVIDSKYIKNTGENPNLIGRKVSVNTEEVNRLSNNIKLISDKLFNSFI